MKQPNTKELFTLKMFKEIIENDSFDEIDIISFLIFLRSLFEKRDKNDFWHVYDICDFVAHRERDKGKTKDGIVAAINNGYRTKKASKQVDYYPGIESSNWKREWDLLGSTLDIRITDEARKDLSICVLSMLQDAAIFDVKDGCRQQVAVMRIMQDENMLSLCSTELTPDSPWVNYFQIGGLHFKKKYESGLVDDPVFAKRIGYCLHLITNSGELII